MYMHVSVGTRGLPPGRQFSLFPGWRLVISPELTDQARLAGQGVPGMLLSPHPQHWDDKNTIILNFVCVFGGGGAGVNSRFHACKANYFSRLSCPNRPLVDTLCLHEDLGSLRKPQN